jgi:dTDP-4-amino-4,6-dideoxygalactose transaminase
MEAIMTLKHNLYVIEDNAQAIGANCKFSDGTKKQELLCRCYFFPSKILGLLRRWWCYFTNDDALAQNYAE